MDSHFFHFSRKKCETAKLSDGGVGCHQGEDVIERGGRDNYEFIIQLSVDLG